MRAGGEEGATEDEMVGWHHGLNGHEFEQTQGDSEGTSNSRTSEGDREALCAAPYGVSKSWTQLNN